MIEFLKKDKLVSIFFLLLFIFNMFQGGFMELSYDEAYYWMYSQFLSWGYFDHPPMVALLIKMGYSIFKNEFGVRLFFNLMSVGTLILAWLMTNRKHPKEFILLAMSFALIQASGFLALPDTPLLFFSTLFFYFTQKYLVEDNLLNTVGLCITIPLLFYSKYHGLLVVLLTLCGNLRFFKRKSFWIIIFSTILLYLPHMYWQYNHDFISFKFHLTERVEKHFDIANIFNYLISQIALFGFFNFFIMLYLIKKIDLKNAWERILFVNIFGFLILLFFMSFRNQIEANWTVSACIAALILTLILIERANLNKLVFISSLFPICLFLFLRIILILPSNFYEDKDIGRLNEIKGWDKRIEQLESIVGNGIMVAETYQYGAKVSFHLGRLIPVKHFRGRDSQYSLLNLTKSIDKNQEIFYLTPRKIENAVKIETGYKDPLYVLKTTLLELENEYGK